MWKIIIFSLATGGITGEHSQRFISKRHCVKKVKELVVEHAESRKEYERQRKVKHQESIEYWEYNVKMWKRSEQKIAENAPEVARIDEELKTAKYWLDDAKEKLDARNDDMSACERRKSRMGYRFPAGMCDSEMYAQADAKKKVYSKLFVVERLQKQKKDLYTENHNGKTPPTRPADFQPKSTKPTHGFKCMKAN